MRLLRSSESPGDAKTEYYNSEDILMFNAWDELNGKMSLILFEKSLFYKFYVIPNNKVCIKREQILFFFFFRKCQTYKQFFSPLKMLKMQKIDFFLQLEKFDYFDIEFDDFKNRFS